MWEWCTLYLIPKTNLIFNTVCSVEVLVRTSRLLYRTRGVLTRTSGVLTRTNGVLYRTRGVLSRTSGVLTRTSGVLTRTSRVLYRKRRVMSMYDEVALKLQDECTSGKRNKRYIPSERQAIQVFKRILINLHDWLQNLDGDAIKARSFFLCRDWTFLLC